MSEDANRDQAAYWNGEAGQRWATRPEILDTVFAPLTAALFDAADLRSGQRALDIGCGAGQTAMIAAERLGPEGHVVAADLSTPLLAVARRRSARRREDAAPIAWLEADAQSHDFGPGSADRVLSRFGVMFFADSIAAFANLRRALAAEGRLTVLCWRAMRENAWVQLPREAVLRVVPDDDPSPPDAPGPFRFADRDGLCAILRAAGFRDVACEPLDRVMTIGATAAAAADVAIERGPISRLLRDREPALRERAHRAVVDSLSAHVEGDAVRLGAACWLVSASG